MMTRFILAICLVFTLSFSCLAEEKGVGAFVRDEALTLRDEAGEFLSAPFRIEGGEIVGTLAVAGAVGLVYAFDDDIRGKVQGIRGRSLDRAAEAGSLIGNPFVHLGIAGAVFGGGVLADDPKWRDIGLMLGEAAVLADAATLVLKETIGRGRPFTGRGKESFRPLQFESDFDSLPSMHAASSFAMASVISRTSESPVVGLLSHAAAAFVGFSRIYEDKHWASDVILGAAIGELAGWVVTRHHAGGGRIALVPAATGSSASLALVGKF